MKDKVIWLRISYWVAAVADFAVAILVLIPERMGVTGYVYPMGLMSAVAFSWAVMLVIADRKPMERRWVLPPTILVVFLIGISGAYAGFKELIPLSRILGSSAVTVVILGLLIYSWFKTRPSSLIPQ